MYLSLRCDEVYEAFEIAWRESDKHNTFVARQMCYSYSRSKKIRECVYRNGGIRWTSFRYTSIPSRILDEIIENNPIVYGGEKLRLRENLLKSDNNQEFLKMIGADISDSDSES
jgi:hypothetical protein